MNIFIRMIGLFSAIDFVGDRLESARKASEDAEKEVGQWALEAIRALAPKDTGHYASTINAGYDGDMFIIGTSEPYGARLEFGFEGPDSMGRMFPFNPQPHFGPVADVLPSMLQTHIVDSL